MKTGKSYQIARLVRRAAFLAGLGTLAVSPVSAGDLVNGKTLYMTHCAGCHGMNGVSVVEQTPNLTQFELFSRTDETLLEVIRSGRSTMPSYFGMLSNQDIQDVIDYLRTLH